MTGDRTPDPDLPPIDLGADVRALLADASTWVEPAPDLGDRVVAAVASETTSPIPAPGAAGRARWRFLRPALIGAATAVVLLFAAVVVFSALGGSDVDQPVAVELVPTGLVAGAAGDIEVSSTSSGLRIDLDAVGLPRRDDGAYYEGWVIADAGQWIPVGTFHEGEGVVLWAGLGLDHVREFTITLEVASPGTETDHGSSGEVVLKADVVLDE
jgi:hypothetical protein